MQTTTHEKIASFRKSMDNHGLDAYIIPSSDPHLSEYPASRWKSREWLSGFTGSAGTLVVLKQKASLWTDSRYFLQAEEQLTGSGIDLHKILPETPTLQEFLLHELPAGSRAGIDGNCYSTTDALELKETLESNGIQLVTTFDLIEEVWNDRPPVPGNTVFSLPVEITGRSTGDKLDLINNRLREKGADCTILGALDEIAWTFNIRGTDVSYNPVAVSYAFISEENSVLFIHPEKLTQKVMADLQKEGVKLADYNEIQEYISRLPENCIVYIDPQKTNLSLYNTIPSHCSIKEGMSPVSLLKSVKNETEKEGFRQAVVKDGIALIRFFMWLEKQLEGGEKVTELSAAEQLTHFRSEQPLYLMDSFQTIPGYAAHGAIVHYAPTPESDSELCRESLFLIDSGAQYLDGTTDITRTIALGEPTEQMKKDFTRVLKGMISLSKAKFPAGTRGCQLDILARKALWDAGINYLHGTGHGIGHCLNVHEGPQSIRMEENPVKLEPGMVISNEPALYRTGEYGIRIENMIRVRKDSETEFGKFYGFETLTLCFIDTRLIVTSMLSARELAWLNKYHQRVYDKLSPHLNEEEQNWLKEKTEII